MATLYFNAAIDHDWSELGNWWTDSGHTVQATSLPTSSDSVVVNAGILSNSGSAPTVVNLLASGSAHVDIDITVTGLATFESSADFGPNNSPTLTGDCVFSSSSSVGVGAEIIGDCTFNDYATTDGDITGDCTFNDFATSDGTITGDCTFNDSAYNNGAAITGDAEFTAATYGGGNAVWNPDRRNGGSVSGTVTFSSETAVEFTVSQTMDFDASDFVFTTPGQSWSFVGSGSGAVDTTGVVVGDCYFAEGTYTRGTITGDCVFDGVAAVRTGADITGNCVFQGSSATMIAGSITGDCVFSGLNARKSDGTITGNCVFGQEGGSNGSSDGRYNRGPIIGDCIFYENSLNQGDITGNCAFYDTSKNDSQAYSASITGDCTFYDSSFNSQADSSGAKSQITGNAFFNDTSYNAGNVSGLSTFELTAVTAQINLTWIQKPTFTGGIAYVYEKGLNGSSILGVL